MLSTAVWKSTKLKNLEVYKKRIRLKFERYVLSPDRNLATRYKDTFTSAIDLLLTRT